MDKTFFQKIMYLCAEKIQVTVGHFLTLDLRGFATGVYFLSLTMNGKSETYKIIKQ